MPIKLLDYLGYSSLAIASLIFIVATIMNLYMRKGLYLMGINMIYDMQQKGSSFVNFIMNLFSLLGSPFGLFPILLVVTFFPKKKIRSYVFLIFIMGGSYFMGLLKLIFQQTRPYWYSSQINIFQWTCPTDFGMPSGHSFISFAMYQLILSDFIGTGKKKLNLYFWFLISIGVVISRMYLGAHSLDQVVFGSLIGLSYLIIYKYWFQKFLYQTLKQLLNQNKKKQYFIINTILALLSIIIPCICYSLNTQSRPLYQLNLDNLNQKCGTSHTSLKLQQNMLQSQISIYLSIGIIYGFIFLKNKDKKDTMFMIGYWQYKQLKYKLLYIAAILLIVVLPSSIFIAVIPHFVDVIIIKYLIRAIGGIYVGFSLVYLMSLVQNKFELIQYTIEKDQ